MRDIKFCLRAYVRKANWEGYGQDKITAHLARIDPSRAPGNLSQNDFKRRRDVGCSENEIDRQCLIQHETRNMKFENRSARDVQMEDNFSRHKKWTKYPIDIHFNKKKIIQKDKNTKLIDWCASWNIKCE